jgi:hypothetical protein
MTRTRPRLIRARARLATVVLACAALLPGAAAAIAAHPKKRAHFSGSFTFTGINGFKAPVTFNVSKDGRTLTGFVYSTLGCFGSGGFQKGVDYYTKPYAIIHVGTVKVSSSGRFSAAGVVSRFTIAGQTTTTTTTLSGSFSSAKSASGHVSFSQTFSPGGGSCHSGALSFNAKA